MQKLSLLLSSISPAITGYLIVGCAGLALIGGLGFGVQTWRIGRLKADIVGYKETIKVDAANYKALGDARLSDAAQAKTSYDSLQDVCKSNFTAALKSGKTIERVTNAPPNADGSPASVDAASLRDILGQD